MPPPEAVHSHCIVMHSCYRRSPHRLCAADRVGENYFAKPSPRHRWFYFPHMEGDEAMLIKQWDSAGDLAQRRKADGATPRSTFALHSAFADPTTTADAPDRESIEVRCIVIY